MYSHLSAETGHQYHHYYWAIEQLPSNNVAYRFTENMTFQQIVTTLFSDSVSIRKDSHTV